MSVSIVIPTGGGRETLLPYVLRGYLAGLPSDGELLVVGDGAGDATAAVVAELASQDARVRYLPGDRTGTAGARNRGIEAARGDLLLFSDDDLVPVTTDFVPRHVRAQRERPGAWVSHMRVPDEVVETPFQAYWQRRLHAGTSPLTEGADLARGGFWFATLSIPRGVLGSERFSDAFAAYGWEEHELGLRLHRRGVRATFLRTAVVHHHDRVRFTRMLRKFREMGRMGWVFSRLHPGPQVALWTGTHPLSRVGRSLLRQPQRARRFAHADDARLTDGQFRLCLEAAYAEGLAEGRSGKAPPRAAAEAAWDGADGAGPAHGEGGPQASAPSRALGSRSATRKGAQRR